MGTGSRPRRGEGGGLEILTEVKLCSCEGNGAEGGGATVAAAAAERAARPAVRLVSEPENLDDGNAIRVFVGGGDDDGVSESVTTGYVSKSENARLRESLSSASRCEASVFALKSKSSMDILVKVYERRGEEEGDAASDYLRCLELADRTSLRRTVTMEDRTFDSWIDWLPELESLEEYLTEVRPSEVSGYDWISIENVNDDSPGYGEARCNSCQDLGRYRSILSPSSSGGGKKRQEAILQLAAEEGYTTGKWLVFFDRKGIDAGWCRIAAATAQGRLGCSAKIAPLSNGGGGRRDDSVCCVYVRDFSDRAEVRRVLLVLKEELVDRRVSGFKPDVYTDLDIAGGNLWNMRPTIYSEKEVLGWKL